MQEKEKHDEHEETPGRGRGREVIQLDHFEARQGSEKATSSFHTDSTMKDYDYHVDEEVQPTYYGMKQDGKEKKHSLLNDPGEQVQEAIGAGLVADVRKFAGGIAIMEASDMQIQEFDSDQGNESFGNASSNLMPMLK